ncbi:MAG: adenine deaminase [Candidatus Acetothermia bacterium]|jgi:adenine deaminase|nr:adenine deaminase [Candidatus Acetothermia bacterium]MDH7505082.1 adenine deaminase [Candidatus Acetothermia bacterium]
MTQELVAVAMGRRPADLVIRDGRWVNLCSGEIIEHTDIAVLGSRIAYCGPGASGMIGPKTEVIEAEGRYLLPGLLDAHLHIESSLLTVTEFARAVLPHGTTGAFIDPHEIANVLGLAGVRLMLEEAARTPLQIYVQVPSCVPAAPGLETPGAELGPEEVEEALAWPDDRVIGLGEVMNYPGLVAGDAGLHRKVAAALRLGKAVGGHYASPDLGRMFHAYAAGGPEDCHEGTRPEDVIARVRQGLFAILRQGSAWQDLIPQLRAVTEMGLEPRHLLLCTDDRHAGTILAQGHMDEVVRLAISRGVSPISALQMATLNTAERFGVAKDVGLLAPGRYADILLVRDLAELEVELVLAAGEVVAERGRLVVELPAYPYPEEAKATVRLKRPLAPSDFTVPAPASSGAGRVAARVRVIEVSENQAQTRGLILELPVKDGAVQPDPKRDVALLAVAERHHASGRIGLGFVKGFGLRAGCALASTVAHDSHNLLIMGTSPEAMALAGNRLAALGGGLCLVRDGAILAEVPLPTAGLMADRPAEAVAAELEELERGLQSCGCKLRGAFMTFSLLALGVIPELRLSDLGLIDVASFALVPLFPEE